ncbi:MAG: transglutaminase-like domain-containing protein [Thiothrix sp.]|uniref:transglutaminase-like domain-containing protein n=1 Tax=Thiothrix sp. TaxID=1032 RepID=UPI00261DBB23|nr:transglutaminase-like domain-containing protein [Thiothrix sp.]MDD5395445.1 transglutaminase-like domain-containing protein [Thiothrix sp.]
MFARILWVFLFALFISPAFAVAKDRSGEVELSVTIAAPDDSKDVRVWIPYPVSNNEQDISNVRISGNFTQSGVYGEKETGNLALYAEWTTPTKDRAITLTFDATARELIKRDFPAVEPAIPVEINEYLKSTAFIPTDGKVKEIALSVTNSKQKISEKARAVYQWVIENTVRDPDVKGCGTGEVEKVIAKKGGKCADISSVFVSVARAAGVPAREVFGLRLGKKDDEDMTGGHHCWAEFYVPGYGWVPADAADVRKAMLVDKLDLKGAQDKIDYYFGGVDPYRIALARGGRGYYLNPRQNDGPLNYFMYPYAEVNGKSLEWLAAQTDLKFKVKFKAH